MAWRPALALMAPLGALAVQSALWEYLAPYAWLLSFPAVVASARLAGAALGALATAVATAGVWWYFVPPYYSLEKEPRQLAAAAGFVCMGLAAVALSASARGRSRERSRQGTAGPTASASAGRSGPDWQRIPPLAARSQLERRERFLAQVGPAAIADLSDVRETVAAIARQIVRELADWCAVDLVRDGGRLERAAVESLPGAAALHPALLRSSAPGSEPPLSRSVVQARHAKLALDLSALELGAEPTCEAERGELAAVRLASAAAVPLHVRGRVVGVIVAASLDGTRSLGANEVEVLEDVAYRTALALENARLLEESRRAVEDRDGLLGLVAHDLRNPLNAIVLQAALLRRQGREPERQRADLIEGAARRMNRLIQDLLDVTRLESGAQSLQLAAVPARALLAAAAEGQRGLAEASSLTLEVEGAAELPEVWADQDRVLQVFENLVGNALKFSHPGGSISLGAVQRGDHVEFWVRDFGQGIRREDLPHVYDRFWQARNARASGAGLGLAIVKGLVEAHGGTVRVVSCAGCGSTFFFSLPRAAASPAEPDEEGAGSLDGQRELSLASQGP